MDTAKAFQDRVVYETISAIHSASGWRRNGANVPQIARISGLSERAVFASVDRLRIARKVHHGGGYVSGIVPR